MTKLIADPRRRTTLSMGVALLSLSWFTPGAAQSPDSAQVHAWALEIKEDVAQFENALDLRSIEHLLSDIESFLGIEFNRQEDYRTSQLRRLDGVYREHGAGELIAEAVRADEGHRWGLRTTAVRMIAERDGPSVAVNTLHQRGLLDSSAALPLMQGVGVDRLDEVLLLLEGLQLEPEQELALRAGVLAFGSNHRPYEFWKRADSLPEPHKSRVRTFALLSSAPFDSIPRSVLEVALPEMVEVAQSFDPPSGVVLSAVGTACSRRAIDVCDILDLPAHYDRTESHVQVEVTNIARRGDLEVAMSRLNELRSKHPALRVARWMAQTLEAGNICPTDECDLIRADSLTSSWLTHILEAEAAAANNQLERTVSPDGTDDLVLLRRSLGLYLGRRDLPATHALLKRMEDPEERAYVLRSLMRGAPGSDLIAAVEIYFELIGDSPFSVPVPYEALVRAGRRDLAELMLSQVTSRDAIDALEQWLLAMVRSGRIEEAEDTVERLMQLATYEQPVGSYDLFTALVALRMFDEYIDHVRALPTPTARVNGLAPQLSFWVRSEIAKKR